MNCIEFNFLCFQWLRCNSSSICSISAKCFNPISKAIMADIRNGNVPVTNDIGKSRTGCYHMAYIFSIIGRYRRASNQPISACILPAYIGMRRIDLYRYAPNRNKVNYRCRCTVVKIKNETPLFISIQIIIQKWNWYQSSWMSVYFSLML